MLRWENGSCQSPNQTERVRLRRARFRGGLRDRLQTNAMLSSRRSSFSRSELCCHLWIELICALLAVPWLWQAADAATIEVASKSFPNAGSIPAKFSCRGANISPELHWSGAPSQTQAFAIIVDDPDAPGGTFTHWIVLGLPSSINHLDENQAQSMPAGARVATNDFDHQGYDGPCPPPGPAHHYHFKLIALDAAIDLSSAAKAADVNAAVAKHAIANGELVGTFQD